MSLPTSLRSTLVLLLLTPPAAADDAAPGQSMHGAAFSDGPRQAAILLGGTGVVRFPVMTKSPEAQGYVTQGVGLLHGFWYVEAERSFRQAAALDPDCPMAYWGMAFANLDGNEKRAAAFVAEAVKREARASPRERHYIDALNDYLTGPQRDNAARRKLASKYEAIVHKYPTDLEAKALLIWQLWENNLRGVPLDSRLAADALIGEVLTVEPRHPAHHYRIHVTDHPDGDQAHALASAAACGPVAPAVPHMWHMPGHTYVRAKRYADAAWQMEAALRVEHAYLTRMRMIPDETHLYVHNRNWLIDNLEYAGRVRDAIDLCKQVIELPRHPGYTAYGEAGRKLVDILARHERWDELRELEVTDALGPTTVKSQQVQRLVAFGRADLARGDRGAAIARLATLNDWCDTARKEFRDSWAAAFGPNHLAGVIAATWAAGAAPSPADFAASVAAADWSLRKPTPGAKPNDITAKIGALRAFEKAAAELRGHIALANGGAKAALELFARAGDVAPEVLARARLADGELVAADEATRDTAGRVYRLADRVDLLRRLGKADAARAAFAELRTLAGPADLDDPPLRRLAPLAASYGWPADWRTPVVPADVGPRPPLDSLGPFHWRPAPAADWSLPDAAGRSVRLADYRGRPVVVILYLGMGCVHCVEQLAKFAPKAPDFAAAGIDVVAIGTDTVEALKSSATRGKLPFTVLADPSLATFRAYRAFDDFERVPLHGTFLIDGAGRVRWQAVGAEPFGDVDFLLGEAKRLLRRQ